MANMYCTEPGEHVQEWILRVLGFVRGGGAEYKAGYEE